MSTSSASSPSLSGLHHVKLPVADYHRSVGWYERVLGFRTVHTFGNPGTPAGAIMRHPDTDVLLGLHVDAGRASSSAGFDYFAFLVEDRSTLDAWQQHLDDLGETTQGIHTATMGTLLALLDPDGHQLLLYAATS